jgi:hypothetical protein
MTAFRHHPLLAAVAILLGGGLAASSSGESPPKLPVEWVRSLGTPTHDISHGVAVDGTGGVYVSHSIDTPISAGFSPYNVAISRFDQHGNEQWSRRFDGRSSELAYGIAADAAGNAYLAGVTFVVPEGATIATDTQGFVKKIDSSGSLLWSTQVDFADAAEVKSVDVDARGNVYVTGSIHRPTAFPTPTDAFVTKLGANGQVLWTRELRTEFQVQSWSISVDDLGNVFTSGTTRGALGPTFFGDFDAFVLKMNDNGDTVWARNFGTVYGDVSYAVQADGEGGAYIGGHAPNFAPGEPFKSDAFVTRYTADGSLAWTRYLSPGLARFVGDLTLGADGSVYGVGVVDGDRTANGGAYACKLSPSGVVQWAGSFGSDGAEPTFGIAVDSSGSVFVSGFTEGTFAGPITGTGADAFVAKLAIDEIPEPTAALLLLVAAQLCAVRTRN